jgi:hypothetical protein
VALKHGTRTSSSSRYVLRLTTRPRCVRTVIPIPDSPPWRPHRIESECRRQNTRVNRSSRSVHTSVCDGLTTATGATPSTARSSGRRDAVRSTTRCECGSSDGGRAKECTASDGGSDGRCKRHGDTGMGTVTGAVIGTATGPTNE